MGGIGTLSEVLKGRAQHPYIHKISMWYLGGDFYIIGVHICIYPWFRNVNAEIRITSRMPHRAKFSHFERV